MGTFSGEIRFYDEIILRHDDSFEGFLTAVYKSYEVKPLPAEIVGSQFQAKLGADVIEVAASEEKAEKVIKGIRNKMGEENYQNIWSAFRSENSEKSNVIYKYIRLGMKIGRSIDNHLARDEVIAMVNLQREVSKEEMRAIEFVRFSETTKGVYYAPIEPKCDVVQLIMPFFADRFRTMPFIIHDTVRNIAGISDMKQWALVDVSGRDDFNMPEFSQNEKIFRQLWKRFYDTIAIKERVSHKRRVQMLPRFLWKHLTELRIKEEEVDTSKWLENCHNRIGEKPLSAGEKDKADMDVLSFRQEESIQDKTEKAIYLIEGETETSKIESYKEGHVPL